MKKHGDYFSVHWHRKSSA